MSAIARVFSRSSRAAAFSSAKALTARQPSQLSKLSYSLRKFSTTPFVSRSGENDEILIRTLKEEIKYEKDEIAEQGSTDFISSFTQKTGFVINDVPGESDATLTKSFGNEEIVVRFTINDLASFDPSDNKIEVFEEGDDNGPPVKMADNQLDVDDGTQDFHVNFSLTITKPSAPTLHFELVAEEGEIGVNQMYFYNDPRTALSMNSEAEFKRRSSYIGPVFGQLSDDLKDNIDAFFEERGIDTGLTMFMQDYIEFKEQKEYLRWLEQFQAFAKA